MTGKTRGSPMGRVRRKEGVYVLPWRDLTSGPDGHPCGTDLPSVGHDLTLNRWPDRLDIPVPRLRASAADGVAALHARAARIARRVARDMAQPAPVLPAPEETLLRDGLVLTDGQTAFACSVIAGPPRLLAFHGRHPAPGTPLRVVRVDRASQAPMPAPTLLPGLVAGTPVLTPEGPCPVEALCPGERVLTRDGGALPVRWCAQQHRDAVQIAATPTLAPLLVCSGTLGVDCPDGDILIAPGHRVMVNAPAAAALFGSAGVLVEVDHLRDSPGAGAGILPTQPTGPVRYIHLALDGLHLVNAGGLWVESFDPAQYGLTSLPASARADLFTAFPALRADPAALGPSARRVLRRPEAAILGHSLH